MGVPGARGDDTLSHRTYKNSRRGEKLLLLLLGLEHGCFGSHLILKILKGDTPLFTRLGWEEFLTLGNFNPY